MQVDSHLVNLSIYLPALAGVLVAIIHLFIKSIKITYRCSSLGTFMLDIFLSAIIIFINLFVFYLCNYGKLKLYSLIIELILYIIFRKLFEKYILKTLIRINRAIKSHFRIIKTKLCSISQKIYIIFLKMLKKA